jgi:hypothetical protein
MVITKLNKLYELLCRLKRSHIVPVCLEILTTDWDPYCTAPILPAKITFVGRTPTISRLYAQLPLHPYRGPLTSVAEEAVASHFQAVRS